MHAQHVHDGNDRRKLRFDAKRFAEEHNGTQQPARTAQNMLACTVAESHSSVPIMSSSWDCDKPLAAIVSS